MSQEGLTPQQKIWAKLLAEQYPKLDTLMISTIVQTPLEKLEELNAKNNEEDFMGTLNPTGGSVCVSEGPATSSPDSRSDPTVSTN